MKSMNRAILVATLFAVSCGTPQTKAESNTKKIEDYDLFSHNRPTAQGNYQVEESLSNNTQVLFISGEGDFRAYYYDPPGVLVVLATAGDTVVPIKKGYTLQVLTRDGPLNLTPTPSYTHEDMRQAAQWQQEAEARRQNEAQIMEAERQAAEYRAANPPWWNFRREVDVPNSKLTYHVEIRNINFQCVWWDTHMRFEIMTSPNVTTQVFPLLEVHYAEESGIGEDKMVVLHTEFVINGHRIQNIRNYCRPWPGS